MDSMKPLSKATRQDIEKQMREQYLEPSEGWFTKGEMLEVLAAESYWREAVKNAQPECDETEDGSHYINCPFCGEHCYYDPHKPDCPWLLAQGE